MMFFWYALVWILLWFGIVQFAVTLETVLNNAPSLKNGVKVLLFSLGASWAFMLVLDLVIWRLNQRGW